MLFLNLFASRKTLVSFISGVVIWGLIVLTWVHLTSRPSGAENFAAAQVPPAALAPAPTRDLAANQSQISSRPGFQSQPAASAALSSPAKNQAVAEAKENDSADPDDTDAASDPLPASAARPVDGAGATSGKLGQAMIASVQNAFSQQTYQCSLVQGGAFAKAPFQEMAPDGLLIGLRVGVGKFFNNDTVKFVQPIYLTPAGKKLGQAHGDEDTRMYDVCGPAGYAVGAMAIRGGGGLDAVTVTFMRIRGTMLDPSDAYDSPRLGGPGGSEVYLGGDGTPIIGICGSASDDQKWLGLGLIFRDHTEAAKPH